MSETALQEYRDPQDALSLSERQNIVGQKLGDLNASVTKAKTDRIGRETQFRQLEALQERRSPSSRTRSSPPTGWSRPSRPRWPS